MYFSVAQEFSGMIQNIDQNTLLSVAESIMHLSGTVLQGLPFGSGLGAALKDFVACVQTAKYNKDAVEVLIKRVAELMKTMSDILAETSDAFANKKEDVFRPMSNALSEASDFINRYCKKGFLKRMMKSSSDLRELQSIDQKMGLGSPR